MEVEPKLNRDEFNEDEIAKRNASLATNDQLQGWIDDLEKYKKDVAAGKIEEKNQDWIERQGVDLKIYKAELKNRKNK